MPRDTIIDTRWFAAYRTRGLWWFRVFGYGLAWKRISDHPLLFSQRTGLRGWRVGNWFFQLFGRPTITIRYVRIENYDFVVPVLPHDDLVEK